MTLAKDRVAAAPGAVVDEASTVDDLVARSAVRSVYQPIVDLESGAVVAFEALARGPQGHRLERPDLLFAAARSTGRLRALDRACQWAAINGTVSERSGEPQQLFVNVEPGSVAWSDIDELHAWSAARGVCLTLEITERDLVSDPVELLRFVERARAAGFGIAVDDVGAELASLAMLPLLRPTVIKLDLRLVQDQPDQRVAEIFSAVNAEAERSGALVLAEGIETEAQRLLARGLGARLGQGFLLGRPGSHFTISPHSDLFRARTVPPLSLTAAPFELAASRKPTRTAPKALLLQVSRHLEAEARRHQRGAVVVSTLQHAQFLTPGTRRRYQVLSERIAFIALLGQGLSSEPLDGVRGGDLDPADPVAGEWDVAVIGPHYAAALIARDLADNGPDPERRFQYVLTHDRELVVHVMSALLGRVSATRHG